MAKYCLKKPVVVDAFQMTIANRLPNDNWPEWLKKEWDKEPGENSLWVDEDGDLRCADFFGEDEVCMDDWITMDGDGWLQVIDPEYFADKFELVQ